MAICRPKLIFIVQSKHCLVFISVVSDVGKLRRVNCLYFHDSRPWGGVPEGNGGLCIPEEVPRSSGFWHTGSLGFLGLVSPVGEQERRPLFRVDLSALSQKKRCRLWKHCDSITESKRQPIWRLVFWRETRVR